MSRLALSASLAALFAAPAAAQEVDHAMHGMSMAPAAKAKAKAAAKTAPKPAHGQVGHDMSSMPGMDMPAMRSSAPPATRDSTARALPPAQDHAGHDMSSMPGMTMGGAPASEPAIPETAPPPPPADHFADRTFDPAAMAAARRQLSIEHGNAPLSKVMANLAEYQARTRGGDGYRWDGQAWFGGDINRLVLRSEGEGGFKEGVGSAEAQALYARAVSRYFDVQIGVRQDFKPRARTYLTLGTEGLAPYGLDVEGALFLSTQGELLGRVEATYDVRLTQRLILQPRVELNLAAQDTPETRTGSGLSQAELGLRLRYEIRREFAPYIGLSYEHRFGRTADFARAKGDGADPASFVIGIRTFF